MADPYHPPSSILIVGCGVFGLSTALTLSRRPQYSSTSITLLDAASTLPNPSGSSVDTSRIVRADYSNPTYARLAAEAQIHWRGEWGAERRYNETGLVLVAETGKDDYVRKSLENVKSIADKGQSSKIEELGSREHIQRAMKGAGVGSGEWGYANWGSGWADAEECVRWAVGEVDRRGKVKRVQGEVEALIYEGKETGRRGRATGVKLSDGSTISADLVVLATGAWTGKLVDLRGRAESTGQCLAYIKITEDEQTRLADAPTLLNISTGMFIIPPRNNILKVARHGYGYRNPKLVHVPGKEEGETMEISLPVTGGEIPAEGVHACKAALKQMMPDMAEREFDWTRICWYTDTPSGNFLIDYHPEYDGLFLATGGSGHGFKFFPVIGEKIVDAIELRLETELKELFSWPEKAVDDFVGCEDGSRAGPRGMILQEELNK